MLHMGACVRIISTAGPLFGLVQDFVSRRLRISEGSRVENIQPENILLENGIPGNRLCTTNEHFKMELAISLKGEPILKPKNFRPSHRIVLLGYSSIFPA